MNVDILVVLGRSQTCKSTLIKLMTQDDSIQVGSGNGQSTTIDIDIFPEQRSIMPGRRIWVDTIGYGDSRLRFTNTEIKQKIELKIIQFVKDKYSIKAIILTESLAEATPQLRENLAAVIEIFG